MATYRQTKTVYESDYGDVTVDIILADTYDNIFTDEYYTIDIIDFKDVDKKLENAIGQLSTDAATFEIDESTFKMNDDSTIVADSKTQLDIDNEALELCTTSTSTAFNYIALFVNTTDTPSFDDALFIGAIDFDYDEDWLAWTGDDYTTTRDPLRKYKFKTTPVQESLFDAISLQEAITAAKTAILSNTIDYDGFYTDGDYKSIVPSLISLPHLLILIKTAYVDLLDSNGYGTFTITYASCDLDGEFLPIRFNKPLSSEVYGHIVSYSTLGRNGTKDTNSSSWMSYDYTDAQTVTLFNGTTNPPSSDTTFLINTNNVLKAEEITGRSYRQEVLEETAEQFLWQNNSRVDDSYTNLLYALATDLGLALEFVFTSQTEIEIRFTPKSDVESSQLYIKNAEKASSKKFQLDQREEEGLSKGVSSYLSKEINGDVIENTAKPTHVVTPSKNFSAGGNTPRALVSLGTALWQTNDQLYESNWDNKFLNKSTSSDRPIWIKGLTIPYNSAIEHTPSGNIQDYVPWNSASLCTSLYLYVAKGAGETLAPANYATPIALLSIKQGSTNYTYSSLETYRRSINNIEHRTYGKDLTLSIPYLMAFSDASNGSGADIKNLTIGRKIVLDTVEYVVTGFKINIQDWKVDVKLENTGRFDYSDTSDTPTGSLSAYLKQSAEDEEEAETITFGYTASGAITAGQLVSLKTATTVEEAVCVNTHYNRVIGVALNDAADTEGVNVQVSGKVEISTLSGSINDAVFLRDVSGTVNTSTTQLTAISGSEDYYLEVGRIVDTNIMQINIKEGFVIQ